MTAPYNPKRDFRSITAHDLSLIKEEAYSDGYSQGFGAGWWWGFAVMGLIAVAVVVLVVFAVLGVAS